jgi:hypothetical protein
MMSDLASVRVPTIPLERARLAMSDTIFHDRYMREVLNGSARVRTADARSAHYREFNFRSVKKGHDENEYDNQGEHQLFLWLLLFRMIRQRPVPSLIPRAVL